MIPGPDLPDDILKNDSKKKKKSIFKIKPGSLGIKKLILIFHPPRNKKRRTLNREHGMQNFSLLTIHYSNAFENPLNNILSY